MSESPVPTVLAMLVCDQIIVDEASKKKSLIGIFDNVNALSFPTAVNCAIYAKLADAEGDYRFKLAFVNLKDESTLTQLEVPAKVRSRLAAADLVAHFVGVVFPEPGKYEVQLWANDIYLSRVTMSAVEVHVEGGQ